MLLFQNFFLYLHDVMWLLQRIENICYLFYCWDLLLLFYFLSSQENLYMICHNWNLFYHIYNIITKHNQRQTCHLLLIPNYFYLFFSESKVLYNFICFITNHDFCVITFWMHYTQSLSLSMEEIEPFAIVNWIFHVSMFPFFFFFSYL